LKKLTKKSWWLNYLIKRKRVRCNLSELKPYERLTCEVLENARRPLTTNEVADYANMSWLTAKKHLGQLEERNIGIHSYKKGRTHLWSIEE